MKKMTAVILSAAMVMTSMSGCGAKPAANAGATGGTAEGAVKIGYSCVDMNNTFQTYLVDAAKKKAAELGVEIVVTDAQNDVVKQQDQIKAMIQQGVNALIVVPADTSAMEPVTAAAQNAGKPIVYCNVNPFGEDMELPENVYYVGSDETQAGAMQGEMIGKELGEGGVAILMGGLTYEASYKRTDGVKNTLAEKYPNMKVLAEETAEWQRDKAIDVTNNWLTAFGKDLKAICANNDEMALGAVEALKAAGRTDIKVMGIDAIPDACASIKGGELLATVFQDSVGQGGGAMEMAVKAAKGETITENITWVPFVLVDKANVADFEGKN